MPLVTVAAISNNSLLCFHEEYKVMIAEIQLTLNPKPKCKTKLKPDPNPNQN